MITPVLLKAIQEATKDRNAARPFFKKLIHLLNIYSIEYVIDGGSLLGAMRDGEEIIWDDDYDIYMTRPNMEKLNAVLKKNITFTTDETYEPFAVRGFDYHFEFSPIGDTATKRIEFFNIIAITDETSEFVPIHICDVFYEGDKSGWPHPTIAELYPMRKAQLGDMELSIPNRAVEYLERTFGQNCINEYTVCNKYLYERGWHPDEKHEYKVINKSIYDKLKLQFQTHNAVDDRMKASRKRNNNRNNEVLRDEPEIMEENASSKSSDAPLREKNQVNSNQVNSNQVNNNENKLLEQMQKRAQHLLDEQHKKLLSVQQNHQQELKSIQKAHRQEMENMQNNHEKDLARMRDLLHEQAKMFSESVNKRYNNNNDIDNDIDIENRQRYLDAKVKRNNFQKNTTVANNTENDESIIKDRFVIEEDDHDHEEHHIQPKAQNEKDEAQVKDEEHVENEKDEAKAQNEEDEPDTKDEEHVENEKDEAEAQNEEDETQVENEEDKTQVKDEEHVENEEHETQEQDEVKEDDSNANKPPEKNDVKQEVATTISNKQAKKKRGRGKNTVSLEITE